MYYIEEAAEKNLAREGTCSGRRMDVDGLNVGCGKQKSGVHFKILKIKLKNTIYYDGQIKKQECVHTCTCVCVCVHYTRKKCVWESCVIIPPTGKIRIAPMEWNAVYDYKCSAV